VNEQLIQGREDIYFGFQFAKAANKLPDVVRYYVGALAADPGALRGSFAADQLHRAGGGREPFSAF